MCIVVDDGSETECSGNWLVSQSVGLSVCRCVVLLCLDTVGASVQSTLRME